MEIIGIVGGAGPLAGCALLKRILINAQEMYGCSEDADYPKIVLINFPFSDMLDPNVNVKQIQRELKECLDELRRCGASILAIACNTLHAFLDKEEKGLIRIPQVLSEFFLSSEEAPLVLCTGTSARYTLYNQSFSCTYLEKKEQVQCDALINSILQGNLGSEELSSFIEVICRKKEQTVVLGCTELSLYAEEFAKSGKVIIDPLDFLAKKITRRAFE